MTNRLAEVVEAAGDEHHPISKARFGVAKAIFDDPDALHPSQNMLNRHPNLADDAIVLPLLLGALRTRLLLDWLIDHHTCGREGLKGTVLMQFTVGRKAKLGAFSQGFVMHGTGRGSAQEADFSLAEVADDHVFIRVRFFLPL